MNVEVSCACRLSGLDVFCIWISVVSVLAAVSAFWHEDRLDYFPSYFDWLSVSSFSVVFPVVSTGSSSSISSSMRSKKLTLRSVLGSAKGITGLSGMIAGVELSEDVGFLEHR